eukprot:3849046-Karenia_brevis.AAC.1
MCIRDRDLSASRLQVECKDFNSQNLANTSLGTQQRVITKRFATTSHASPVLSDGSGIEVEAATRFVDGGC